MPIDETQQRKLETWIHQKCGELKCVACESKEWKPGDVLVPPSAPEGGGTIVGGPSFPMVQLICENCGNVLLFSTLTVGIGS